jgi:hypothetical protein
MINNQVEYILCSAIWYKEIPLKKEIDLNRSPINIDKGVVFCGHRHPHCIQQLNAVTGLRGVTNGENSVGEYVQGFLTSKNRFVDRIEAAFISFLAGQIDRGRFNTIKELHSEDLW